MNVPAGFVRDLQNWVQRGKKAPDFSRGDELPLCNITFAPLGCGIYAIIPIIYCC